jgi:cell division protein ZapA
MGQISLTINDRSYNVTCDDGQEDHLRKLAEHLDERVRELTAAIGHVGEGRLLVMASLVVADELFEAYKQLHAVKAGADPEDAPGDVAAAETLEVCAQRIEAIAARLEGA